MPRAVLLRCPVCDAVRALDGEPADRPHRELYAVADAHVREHSGDGTTTTVRKHHVVAGSTELRVSESELDRLPTDRWRDCDAADLPSDAMPPGATRFRPAEAPPSPTRVDD